MKRIILVALAAGLAAPAVAQTTTTTTTTTIEEPQIETIRTYVTEQKTVSTPAPEGFSVTVGSTLPEPVPLYRLPEDVGPAAYEYAVVDGHTVLVDENRNIVEIID